MEAAPELDESRLTPMQEFYSGSTVFVTGATGFLGRLLVEKLLRACRVDRIYVMVREKKGKTLDARLAELFDGVAFDRLRAERPDFRDRIVGLNGDCSMAGLGISAQDREMLVANVNFVFHCAATVNFDEQLRTATLINVRGTREVLRLAHAMRRLTFVAHVSTAYAHCVRSDLVEAFRPAAYGARELISIIEQLPAATADRIEPILVDDYPNTYIFTKTISEQLVEELDDFPIAVFRPGIIVSTFREPLPGWINNFYGPQGVTAAAMIGLMRTLHCDDQLDANIVPADMCVNALLAMPWDARAKYDEVVAFNKNAMEVDEHNLQRRRYKAPVYHFESNSTNPINWSNFRELTHRYRYRYCTVKMIGIYFFYLHRNYYAHLAAAIFMHYLPAVLFDAALLCGGRKPTMIPTYRKLHKFAAAISYFSTRAWRFESGNYLTLCDRMSEPDARLFFCDLRRLDWSAFFQTYLMGCRQYLIKDPLDTVPAALRRQRKLLLATCSVLFAFFLLVGSLLYKLLC